MTAVEENAPSRKRIATYGKAARKRLPEYSGSSEHYSSSQGTDESSKAKTPFHSLYNLSRISRGPPSSPAPSGTSNNSNVFDFPSSDDERATTPKKRRRVVAKADHTNRKSPHIKRQSRISVETLRLDTQAGREKTTDGLSPAVTPLSGSEKLSKTPESRRIAPEDVRKQDGYRQLPDGPLHRPSANPKERNGGSWSSNDLRGRKGSNHSVKYSQDNLSERSREASKIANARALTAQTPPRQQPPSSQSTTPHHTFDEDSLEEEEEPSRKPTASPAVLTPKGLRMWNGLLGNVTDDISQDTGVMDGLTPSPERAHTGTLHRGQPPRKRLIDSLAPQPVVSDQITGAASDSSDPTSSSDGERSSPPLESRGSMKADIEPDTNPRILASHPVSSSQITGPKITYSRQRSMLAEADILESLSLERDIDTHPSQSQQHSRGIFNPAPKLLPVFEMEEEDEDGSGAIRSVHELRQAGANKRYLDEMEDLLDRIGSLMKKSSLRRSGLLEMAEKLHDKEFHRNFVNHAMDQRLFVHLGEETDIISGSALLFLLLILLDTGMTPVGISNLHEQGVTRLLTYLVDIDESIVRLAKDRKANMSKTAQSFLEQEQGRLLDLGIWDPLKPQHLTPRTLALQCTDILLRQSREAGGQAEVTSKELVAKIFTVLEPLSRLKSPEEMSRSQAIDFRLSLSILEAQSLTVIEKGDIWYENHFPLLRDILKMVVTASLEDQDSLELLVLRLTLNITNNNSNASNVFATAELLNTMSRVIVEKLKILSHFLIEAERLILVDHLVLMLGVMINFAEWSSRARHCFALPTDSNEDPLRDMVRIFSENLEKTSEADSMESIHLNVAFGYLSVLLGTLCLSTDVAERVKSSQPNRSLQSLITSIEEFISHHKKVDSLLEDEYEGQNPQAGLTQRLSRVVDALREKCS